MSIAQLNLEPICDQNWREANGVRVAPGQLKFVADHEPVALVILSKAFVRLGNVDWYPYLITTTKETIGVVAITQNSDRCEIYHLLIDQKVQGKGYGKASVLALIKHIRETWQQTAAISLTVHPNNQVAMHVYKSCGFNPTGDFKNSEPVMELRL